MNPVFAFAKAELGEVMRRPSRWMPALMVAIMPGWFTALFPDGGSTVFPASFRWVVLLSPMTLPALLRGVTPGDGDRAGEEAHPALPVAPWHRAAARTLVSLLGVGIAFSAIELLADHFLGGRPATNPFAGAGLSLAELTVALPPLLLVWFPLFLSNALSAAQPRGGSALTMVAGVVAGGLAVAFHAEQSFAKAAVFAAVATPGLLLLGVARPAEVRPRVPDLRWSVGSGLFGLVATQTLSGTVVALTGAAVAVVAAGVVMGVSGVDPARVWPVVRATAVPVAGMTLALAPVIPSTGRHTVHPAAGATFRLPVGRLQTTLLLVGASVLRAWVVMGITFFVAGITWGEMGFLAGAVTSCAALLGASAAWETRHAAVPMLVVVACTVVVGSATLLAWNSTQGHAAALGAQAFTAALALLLVVRSAGWLGRSTGRALG